jgi:putative hydrolase of the HAD superfamily
MLQLNQTPPTSGNPYSNAFRHPKPAIDAVLFDLFDTLVLIDNEHDAYVQSLKKTHRYLCVNGLNCTFTAFKQAYLRVTAQIERETTVSLEEPHFSGHIERTIAELGQKLKDQTFLAIDSADEFSKEFKKHVTVDPQALEVLALIRRKHKVGVISNLTFSECAWELLEEFNLKAFLDVTVVSGDINLRKPHTEIFNMTLRYLGVKPYEAVFVGDTLETDVLGAKRAGMTAVHIQRRPPKTAAVKPHRTITQLRQLLPIVGISHKQNDMQKAKVNLACPI